MALRKIDYAEVHRLKAEGLGPRRIAEYLGISKGAAEYAAKQPIHRHIKPRDACFNGHPFTPENTIIHGNPKGRECRACRNERKRQYRAALAAHRAGSATTDEARSALARSEGGQDA